MEKIDKNEFLRDQLDLLKRKQSDSTIEWQDLADFRSDYVGELEHRDTVRKGSKLLYEYIDAGWVNEPLDNKNTNVDFGSSNEVMAIQKERYKLQTAKLENNKWLRELARDELITEQICNAITSLPQLEVPEYIPPINCNRTYLLAFGDLHDGISFEVKDLYGSVINSYSPEILEDRIWDMCNQVIALIEGKNIKELSIYNLGDNTQGIIRLTSQLQKLRLGVVDATIHCADLLAKFLNELSKHTRIKYQMVEDSNHDQLRICGAKKNAFSEENMGKVIQWYLKSILKDNPNITILENPTGMNYGMFSTYSVLGVHGEVKNLAKSLNEFSRAYNTPIDYVIGAHRHHISSEECGIRSEAISIRSIIGVDPYGMSLQKVSDAGASLFTFDQIKGLVCEDRIVLN